jgi:hypothetical protein
MLSKGFSFSASVCVFSVEKLHKFSHSSELGASPWEMKKLSNL